MRQVQARISEKQLEFEQHPFFERLERDPAACARLPFAESLSFWVLSFQDILRLNERRIGDPRLRRIARHHRVEDGGHEQWFLTDLPLLGQRVPDAGALFGKVHEATRIASYELLAEVYRAADDASRITLLLTLESTGHVFFERTAACVHRASSELPLKYFSYHHLDVEKSHVLFEQEIAAELDALVLDDASRAAALAVVERCYDAFTGMFDGLERWLPRDAGRSESPSVPPM